MIYENTQIHVFVSLIELLSLLLRFPENATRKNAKIAQSATTKMSNTFNVINVDINCFHFVQCDVQKALIMNSRSGCYRTTLCEFT